MKFSLTTLITAFTLATQTVALGINCRGSSNCAGTTCDLGDLQNAIDLMDDGVQIHPGDHIACCGDQLCAFTQNTQQIISGADAKQLIAAIANHGCNKCGSMPFADNNVNEGELTVNWVSQGAKRSFIA